jgi:hypothetical protein
MGPCHDLFVGCGFLDEGESDLASAGFIACCDWEIGNSGTTSGVQVVPYCRALVKLSEMPETALLRGAL